MMFTVEVTGSGSTGFLIMNGEGLMKNRGFTYPAALLLIIVTSVSLMAVQAYWSTIMKREREKELLFRGGQIRKAIESYCTITPGGSGSYPKQLKDLLRDSRFPAVKRHLRRIYKDPMTKDGTWGIILGNLGTIKGVYSKSAEKPLKQENFPEEFKDFEQKNHYSDWKFIYEPGKKKPT